MGNVATQSLLSDSIAIGQTDWPNELLPIRSTRYAYSLAIPTEVVYCSLQNNAIIRKTCYTGVL